MSRVLTPAFSIFFILLQLDPRQIVEEAQRRSRRRDLHHVARVGESPEQLRDLHRRDRSRYPQQNASQKRLPRQPDEEA